MTLRAAEKICGLGITAHEDGMYCGIGEDGEFWVHANDDKEAAQRLIDLHWRRVCTVVMRRQDFKCLYCARLVALSVHHLKKRSHGRSDRPSGLVALCDPCHRREHGIRVI